MRATLYVDTAPGVNVPAKSAEIQETAIAVLEDQLGLKVKGGVKVVVRPVPPPEGAPGTLPPPPIAHREAVEESHPVEDMEVVQVKTPAPEAPTHVLVRQVGDLAGHLSREDHLALLDLYLVDL